MASTINNGRFIAAFPASVFGSGPVTVTKVNLTYTFGADFRPLVAETSSVSTASLALVQNAATGAFTKITLANLLANNQALDATLTALAALDGTTGAVEQTGADTFTKRPFGTATTTSIITRGDGDGRYQPLDATLTALAGLDGVSGVVEQTGVDVFTKRLIGVANATDLITRSNADARFQPLDGDLTAIAALGGTNTLYYRSAADTWSPVGIGSGIGFSGGTLSNTASTSAPVGVITNTGLSASVAANALTITLTTAVGATPSGSDIVSIPFRSSTAGTGTITQRSVSAATTLVISSGSTLGATNATPFRLWIVAFDDAGTLRLGAINCLSALVIYPLTQFTIASSTAEGGAGAADNAATFYTGVAVSSKAYAVLGHLEWSAGLTTAGTWDAVPTRISPYRSGMKMPGDVVQVASAKYTTYANTAATIPYDNTIPQNSEGAQWASVPVTFSSAANLYEARSTGAHSVSAAAYVVAAMFRSDSADAIDSSNEYLETAGGVASLALERVALCGSTSALTWSVRSGCPTASGVSVYVNGTSAGARFAGSAPVGITVREIQT